jgi:O-antigen/teichoic acid export membrane protein
MSLKRQTVWSMLPVIVPTAVNLVSVPLFYRYLGPDHYALWFYVLTFTGAFGFMDLGLGVAVGRYVGISLGKDDLSAAEEYWGTGNAIMIPLLGFMALVISIIGVVWGPRWFNVSPADVSLLQLSFIAGGIGLFFSYYGQLWLILSQAHLDFRFVGIIRTAISVFQVGVAVLLVLATRDAFLLIAWSAASSALQLAILIWHARRSYRIAFAFRSARWVRLREMAAYTAKTFVTLFVNSFFGTIDRLILGKIAPSAEFAHYMIGANAGSRVQALSQATMGPIFNQSNRAVSTGLAGVASIYDEAFGFLLPAYASICALVAVWHPVLLRLWLGANLASQVSPLFTPLVIGCSLTALAGISSAQLASLNRLGLGLIFTLLAIALLAAGVFVGWRVAGVVGVAWGFLVSRVGLLAQDLFVIRTIKAGGWLASRTWKHIAIQTLIAGLFSMLFLWWPASHFGLCVPATIHALLLAAWVLGRPLQKVFFRFRAPLKPRSANI